MCWSFWLSLVSFKFHFIFLFLALFIILPLFPLVIVSTLVCCVAGDLDLVGTLTAATMLDLSNNRLMDASGALQPVGALMGLTSLNLAANPGLAGSTVAGLAPLTRLSFLSVNASGLVGTMDSLSALTRLTSLDVCENAMTGTLSAVSAMTGLVYLDVDTNQIAGMKLSEIITISVVWII